MTEGSRRGSLPLETIVPSGWPRPRGYSQAVRVPAGRELLFVAGQIGWDASEQLVGADFPAQFEQALRNCVTVVQAAGGGAGDIVRLTMYCTDRGVYLRHLREVGIAYRRIMGEHYPCMSLVQVAALVEQGAQIEIEATAALAPETGAEGGR
ncbi:MAG TPA: RidA family protein [Planctomycetota bacterium]|nr:RidA family protein [Planctomycetota bacterium]